MSYQVLARKWRPNNFSELVGQEHVVTAISNALDNNRLHHAYLFTGTRGVGKTTIARIFSKSLNCETGMSSTPCGVCGTCKEIEQGNFIDLLEIDAASRTKVEDTRELLDNVQYKPTRGEYKVYLIDEVHMLSKHSFNALLKTLEEPPPHVKFLLATTDPQKLPVTILSRCLQFNLKALSRSQISEQIIHILGKENIPAEADAIAQLSRAAQGSMRDALSLTDQAIAQGNGQISNAIVTDMLGLMDKGQILKLVHAVLTKENNAVIQQVEQLSLQAPDYAQILAEILSLLHQVALTQFVPDACKLETISARAIYQLAKTMPAEHVQLLYQIALQGKKDLPFAADGRSGLEMTLLRMLAFSPAPLNLSIDEFTQQDAPVAELSTVQETHQVAHQNPPQETAGEPVSVEEPQTDQAQNETQESLSQQQQQIIEQAEVMHPDVTAQMVSPDTVEPQHLEEPPVFDELPLQDYPETLQSESIPMEQEVPPQPDMVEEVQAQVPSSTESLLELKQKLQQNPVTGQQETPSPVKKSEPEQPDTIGQLLAQKTTEVDNDTEVTVEPSVQQQETSAFDPFPPSDVLPEIAGNTESIESQQQDTPPWQTEEVQPVFVGKASATLEPQPAFDPTSHLEEDVDVEVDFDVPAFLSGGEKVVAANQLDTWSQLIEQMNVSALTKQLALHSSYSKQENHVYLTLLESKHHLNTASAREQLQSALTEALQQEIELSVNLDQPINTPYAVQQSINQVRQEYAKEVVETNESILRVRDTFSASVVEHSIKPR